MCRSVAPALLGAALLVVVVAACGPANGRPNLGAGNGTTIEVAIVVNGVEIDRLAAGERVDGLEGRAGPMPWLIQLETIGTSRPVLTMRDEGPASDPDGISSDGTFLTTVDLTCGRLEAWTGDRSAIAAPPLPANPGRPGDCDP